MKVPGESWAVITQSLTSYAVLTSRPVVAAVGVDQGDTKSSQAEYEGHIPLLPIIQRVIASAVTY